MLNDLLTRIHKRIDAFEKGYRQNIGIIGPQGFGKSRCLGKIYESLIGQGSLIPVYIEAFSDSYERLVDRWIGAVCSGVFMSRSVQPPRHLPALLNAAEPIIPKTLEKINHLKRILRKEPPSTVLRELFALTGIVEAETGKKVILLIDEFDQLENLPVQDPFSLLGKEIMVETQTLFLVSSSRSSHAKIIFREKLALLFSNFEVMELGCLTFREADAWLESQLESIRLSIPQRKLILRLTDGNPFYLHRISEQVKTAVQSNLYGSSAVVPEFFNELPPQFIWEAIERELFQEHGSLRLLFEKKLESMRIRSRDGRDQVHILCAVSQGAHQVSQIASFIGRKVQETKKLLQRALDLDYLKRSGSFYYLEDYMLSFWLRFYFEWQTQAFLPSHLFADALIKQTIQREYLREESEDESTVMGRILELMKSFRGEHVLMEDKKYILPSMNEVTGLDDLGSTQLLLARAGRKNWMISVHFETFREEDITEILQRVKQHKKPVGQKIVIALRGVEQNAKLLAAESKMQIWELKTLNQMLYFFNLPKILMLPKKETHEPALGPMAESLHTA